MARGVACTPALLRLRLLPAWLAVSDQDVGRSAALADGIGVSDCGTDWRALLDRLDVLAVGIATPDFAHGTIALAAMQAGKHALVEKPLAMTVRECEEILAAQRAKGVKLMVDFHNRWSLPFVNLRRAIAAGQLGTLMMMNIRLNDTRFVPTRMLSWAAKSSPLQFLGSHVVDLIHFLSGAAVQRVYAVSRSVVLKGYGRRDAGLLPIYPGALEWRNGGGGELLDSG